MKMKKFLAMALTGAMCVGLLAGCSNGSSGEVEHEQVL